MRNKRNNIGSINWTRFPKVYNTTKTHWYVSKFKEYTYDTLVEIREALTLLNKWFIEQTLNNEEQRKIENFVRSSKLKLDLPGYYPIRTWNLPLQLYFTYILDEHNIISDSDQNDKIKRKYGKVFEEIKDGVPFRELEQKYDRRLLVDISANARNFIGFYKKIGFAWVEEGKTATLTSTGEVLISEKIDLRVVWEKQLIKWQLFNPTLRKRYRPLRIFPFLFLLRLLSQLDPPHLSKEEYALFVTKAQAMDELPDVLVRIKEWRNLDRERQLLIKRRIQQTSQRTPRSLLDELLDSAGKEIGFFTIPSPLREEIIDGASGIKLIDRDYAINILRRVGNPVWIDFENEVDWFTYYGSWNKGPSIDDAIEYYSEIGEPERAYEIIPHDAPQEVREKVASCITEKDIEDVFEKKLSTLERGLRTYPKGRQFPTEIGRIDILAVDQDKNFVVIEFKRGQSADETIGQLLRYMGWVHINLAGKRRVRGVIVASEIDDKLKYATVGMQHPQIKELMSFYTHPIKVEKIDVDRFYGHN